jgi:hypothetical protein
MNRQSGSLTAARDKASGWWSGRPATVPSTPGSHIPKAVENGRVIHRRGVTEIPACTSWDCPGSTPAARPCSPSSTGMPHTSPTRSPPTMAPAPQPRPASLGSKVGEQAVVHDRPQDASPLSRAPCSGLHPLCGGGPPPSRRARPIRVRGQPPSTHRSPQRTHCTLNRLDRALGLSSRALSASTSSPCGGRRIERKKDERTT